MSRRTEIGLLICAGVLSCAFTLGTHGIVALGHRVSDIAASIERSSHYHHLPRLQTAAGGVLADDYVNNSYDGSGLNLWGPSESAYQQAPAYQYPSAQDQFAPLSTPPPEVQAEEFGPLYVPQPVTGSDFQTFSAPTNYDGGFGSQSDFQAYTPQTTTVSPGSDFQGYTTETQTVSTGSDFQPYVDTPGQGCVIFNGQQVCGSDAAGISETQMYAQKNPISGFANDTQVTDLGSWGGNNTLNNVLYNNTVYNNVGYNTLGGSATGAYVPQTWYTQAFPGIGQSVIPLLPPQYRPAGYGTSLSGSVSLVGNGFGLSVGLSSGAPSYYAPSTYYQDVYSTLGYPYGYNYLQSPSYYNYFSPSVSVAPLYGTASAVAPTCSIALSPQQIAYGGSTSVSWAAYNATGAALNGYGTVPLSGSQTLSGQTASRTIGLTVSGAGGTGACYATLVVGGSPSNNGPTCEISVHPDHIHAGENANLAWITHNATAASLQGVGSVAQQGGRTVSPAQSSSFVLSVTNGVQTNTCSTSLVVN